MPFKDVLLALTSYPDATPDSSIDRALTLCSLLTATVTAVAFEGKVTLTRSTNMLTNMLIDLPGMLAEERAKSVVHAKHLLEYSKASAIRLRVPYDCQLAECNAFEVPDTLVGHAKLHDLTILPLQDGYSVEQWYAETVIFGSGRPAIILPGPGTSKAPLTLDRVTVAWDFSRPAARALADAMPLLEAAKHVRVVTIANEKAIEGMHSPSALADHLLRHGIEIKFDAIDAQGRSAGAAISDYLADTQSDLLVMGAYGHSRVKEFILGGTTRSMLDKPPVPVFLSH